jgi:hypothetical protein
MDNGQCPRSRVLQDQVLDRLGDRRIFRSILRVNLQDPSANAKVATPDGLVLNAVATLCGPGDCPTVYTTDRNTIVVQGYVVAPELASQTVPAGEALVEIPADLLALAVQNISRS